MRSNITVIVLVFAVLGLLLGIADSLPTRPIKLSLTADKLEYAPGDTVTLVATNQSDDRLVFSTSALGLQIENLDTGEQDRIVAGQVFSYLEPGESKTLSWESKRDGEPVEPGTYRARITTSQTSLPGTLAEAVFKISE